MEKTAVEWLVEHLTEYGFDLSHHKIEIGQAKEKEKQQIMDANRNGVDMVINNKQFITGEQYYNETFK